MAAPTPPALGLATVRTENPYIHFDRDQSGRITAVRQRREGSAMPAVGEADIGLFAMSDAGYREWLPRYAASCPPGAATEERNFLPFIPWLGTVGQAVVTVSATDPAEAVGINTPADLDRMARELATRSAR